MRTKEKFMLLIVSFLFMSITMAAQGQRMTNKTTTENQTTQQPIEKCTIYGCYLWSWEKNGTEIHVKKRACPHEIPLDVKIAIRYTVNGITNTHTEIWDANKQTETRVFLLDQNAFVDINLTFVDQPKKDQEEDVKVCPKCHNKPSTITVRWEKCGKHMGSGCKICDGHLGWPAIDGKSIGSVYYCRKCAKYYFMDDLSEISSTRIEKLVKKKK